MKRMGRMGRQEVPSYRSLGAVPLDREWALATWGRLRRSKEALPYWPHPREALDTSLGGFLRGGEVEWPLLDHRGRSGYRFLGAVPLEAVGPLRGARKGPATGSWGRCLLTAPYGHRRPGSTFYWAKRCVSSEWRTSFSDHFQSDTLVHGALMPPSPACSPHGWLL